jgi:predicted nucleic acid-binding protein
MNIILNSNILFSAIIRNSETRRQIVKHKADILIPEKVFEEINKHKKEIEKKSGLGQEEVEYILKELVKDVRIITYDEISTFVDEALEIMKNIDIYDAEFIACGLAFPGSIIWSDDKNLKKQNRVNIINTKELNRTHHQRQFMTNKVIGV